MAPAPYNRAAMLLTPGNLFRGLILLLLAAHVFYQFCLARTWGGAFGFHLGQTILAAAFSLVMLVPFLWAVTVPEWPEIFARHRRGRRLMAGRCPGCNYDMHDRGLGDGTKCPECGEPFRAPEPYRFAPKIFKAFIIINVLAWVIGCGGGLTMIHLDEAAFRADAESAVRSGVMSYSRERRWPGVGSLYWDTTYGYRGGEGDAAVRK